LLSEMNAVLLSFRPSVRPSFHPSFRPSSN
jgi:hypothetical protein